jgi:glycosyltransferase involved in cell wall biosynthesis
MPEPATKLPIAREPLSVVLLALDQEPAIVEVVHAWITYLETLQRPFEILVVDGPSSSSAGQTIETLLAQEPRARFLSPEKPGRAGAALRTGLAAAQFPLLFYGDCSQSYQPAALAALLDLIDQVDAVCGYRTQAGRPLRLPAAERWYAWYVRLLFGLRLRDIDCPFKLFRREIFARIPIQSDGPFVHAEILAKANFLGCLMAEAPVNWDSPELAALPRPLRGLRRAEAWGLFRHPDFGPARVEPTLTPPTPE